MEFYLARALQICCLNEAQLAMVHRKERRRCLANHEIQDLCNISTIKSWFGVPDDPLTLAAFAGATKTKLQQHGIGFIFGDNIPFVHAFDLAVFGKKEILDLRYVDASGRGRKLREMV